MKKTRLLGIVFGITLILCCFSFIACNHTHIKDEIGFKTLIVDGKKGYVTVSNSVVEYNFSDEITVSGKAAYVISLDEYGIQQVLTKIVPIKEGDNTVYVFETIDGNITATYEIVIRRKPLYTVSFNTDGGTAVDNQIIEEGSFATEPNGTPQKNGYTFDGWDYDFANPITQNTKISAEWIINQYTLTIVYGNRQENKVITQDYDTAIATEVNPSRVGYTFDGWDKVIPTTMPAENVTVTAKWKINQYILTFVYGNGEPNKDITQDYDTTIATEANPSRAGYTFDGWDKVIPDKMPAENVTITAKWIANKDTPYKVEYYLQNLKNDYYTLETTEDKTGTTDTTATADIKNFEHFTAEAESVTGNINGNGSTVLKVYYTRDKYTVTFDGNGGTLKNGSATQSIKYGGTVSAPIFEKTGYTFVEWDKTIDTVSENVTITAEWKINQYTLTIVYGNGQENKVITQDYDTAIATEANPSRGGYTFDGWSRNDYYWGSFTIPTKMPAYDMTITAKWIAIFTLDGGTITGLTYHGETLSKIEIPSIIDGVTVTSIGSSAFSGCSNLEYNKYDNAYYLGNKDNPYLLLIKATSTDIMSCTINDNCRFIYSSAFNNCTLLVEIKYNAINCSDLSKDNYAFGNAGKSGNGLKVTVGKTVTKIPAYLFYPCTASIAPNITEVVFEEGSVCKSIGQKAFWGCSSLINIKFPNSMTSIEEGAFSECYSIENITIPDSVTSLEAYAFYHCTSLESVIIGNGLKSVGYWAFCNCTALTNITIGNNVTSIEECAFRGRSSLSSIIIPDSVTSIGEKAFYGRNQLANVTIGNGVKSIGSDAFSDCKSIENIYYNGDINAWVQVEGIANLMRNGKLTKALYINGELLKEANIITATRIDSYAFYYCASLKCITIPDCVTSIGNGAFHNCTSLTSVTIGNGVENIGNEAFYNCSSLTNITIPDSVTSIGDMAFYHCTSLISVMIGNGVKGIGYRVFDYCKSLVEIKIGSSVKSIGEMSFNNSSLETVYYVGTEKQWLKIYIADYNNALSNATKYYYSETEPALNSSGTAYDGNYWHYDTNGKTILFWDKQ